MIQAKKLKQAGQGRLIGYARVSTEEQGTDPQLDELHRAGCAEVLQEHASGADRTRPVLARLLRDIRPGDTPVVVRLGCMEPRFSWTRGRRGVDVARTRDGRQAAANHPRVGRTAKHPGLVLLLRTRTMLK